MTFYYLSFAGPEGFRGATVVAADDAFDAISKTHRMKINPGGEILILEVPADQETSREVIDCLNRLVGRDEQLMRVVHMETWEVDAADEAEARKKFSELAADVIDDDSGGEIVDWEVYTIHAPKR